MICYLLTLVTVVALGSVAFSSNVTGAEIVRYTALILDTSGSMSGTPAQKQSGYFGYLPSVMDLKQAKESCRIRTVVGRTKNRIAAFGRSAAEGMME